MNKDHAQLNFFLDLLNAGYKNALVTIIDFNFGKTRIEIDVPNVGSLRVYQSFSEIDDVQIPTFEVFCTLANMPNVRTKMIYKDLKSRAIYMAYKSKAYFESHPEHIVENESELLKKIQNNKKMIAAIHQNNLKKRGGWMSALNRQK